MDDALARWKLKSTTFADYEVLILVVMDDALAPEIIANKKDLEIVVLILVVMDDALARFFGRCICGDS